MIKIRIEAIIGLFVILAISLFLFLTIYFGIFRFDSANYNTFNIIFDDVTGLNKKDEVKISGVKVGWVEDIVLDPSDWNVHVAIKVRREYELHQNARALTRQDGLLGARFLDIERGDRNKPVLLAGEQLDAVGSHAPSFEDVLERIHSIAKDVSDIARTSTKLLGSHEGIASLQKILKRLNQLVINIAHLTETTEGATHGSNQQTLGKLVTDLGTLINDLNQQNIPTKLKNTLATFEETSKQITQAAASINKGEGVLGTLMCDDSCRNIQQTITCVQDTVSFFQNVHVGLDTHAEFMLGKNEHTDDHDIKGYYNAFLCPCDNYFLLGGLVSRSCGRVKHKDIFTQEFCHEVEDKPGCLKRHVDIRKFDDFLWNFQVGKTFGCIGVRGGLFENTVGVALDLKISLFKERCTWISSFEAFDFNGKQRIDDDRPHLKWLNRLFFNKYLYLVVGADDFISRNNSNAFVGGGVSFSI